MKSCPAQRRRRAALGAALLLALLPVNGLGHWLEPKEIVAGLNQNPRLRDSTGLVTARQDAKLPRLLIIEVRRQPWETIPPEKRLALAQDWYDTWRHNVDQGIVAIVDVTDQKSLVNFDGLGKAKLAP